MTAQPTTYPPTLTEVEQVEIAHALGFHFGPELHPEFNPDCRAELGAQYEIICAVVQRILNRRAKARGDV